jgi:hypothetical protein
MDITVNAAVLAGGFFLRDIVGGLVGDALKDYVKNQLREFFIECFAAWKCRRLDGMAHITSPVHRAATHVEVGIDEQLLGRLDQRHFTDEEIESAFDRCEVPTRHLRLSPPDRDNPPVPHRGLLPCAAARLCGILSRPLLIIRGIS